MKKQVTFSDRVYGKTLARPKVRRALNDFLFFFLWRIAFRLHSLKKPDKKTVLFVANTEPSMSNDFRLLVDYYKSHGFNVVCLYKFKSDYSVFGNEWSKIKKDLEFQKYFARAGVTYLNDFYLAAYANKPRKGTRLVQLWHGCGAFKRFSYSIKDASWGLESDLFERYNVHKNYTDIVISSRNIIPQWSEAFDAEDGVIKALGTPRTDVFFDKSFVSKQRKTLEEMYPSLVGKKLVLWAPTLRGKDVRTSFAEKCIDFIKLKNALGDDYAFLMKLHPKTGKMFDFTDEEKAELDGFLFDISKDVSVNTALCAADVCVTDYSSLIFEYSLLNRPMIFYAYDLNDYKGDRNFYFEYEDFVPGEICMNTDELIYAIQNTQAGFDSEKLVAFREKFMSACDGKSTERVAEYMIK